MRPTLPSRSLAPTSATELGANNASSGWTDLADVFAVAGGVGGEIIAKIPPTLHAPLRSGSNAISGITVIGAILATGSNVSTVSSVFGFLAVVLATINVVGGFMVTNRMLAMFKPKK